jgi:hypothetical protein
LTIKEHLIMGNEALDRDVPRHPELVTIYGSDRDQTPHRQLGDSVENPLQYSELIHIGGAEADEQKGASPAGYCTSTRSTDGVSGNCGPT